MSGKIDDRRGRSASVGDERRVSEGQVLGSETIGERRGRLADVGDKRQASGKISCSRRRSENVGEDRRSSGRSATVVGERRTSGQIV